MKAGVIMLYKLFNCKSFFYLSLFVMLLIGWRIYQEDVPAGFKAELMDWKANQNTIIIYNEDGEDVTQQFFSANQWNYLLRNYRGIYCYINDLLGEVTVIK